MPEEPVEDIVARVDHVCLPGSRVRRCVDLAEAVELTPTGGPEGNRFREAILWGDVRTLVDQVFRGPAVRVGDLRVPDGSGADVVARFAEVLGKAVAAEELPMRVSVPEGAAERVRLHRALVERLTRLFHERLTSF